MARVKSEARSMAAKARAATMPRVNGKFVKRAISVEAAVSGPPRKRGRPRGSNYYSKAALPALPPPPSLPPFPSPPKRKSRKKYVIQKEINETLADIDKILATMPPKKKRGRPPGRKAAVKKTLVMIKEMGGEPPKKRRGRPRKAKAAPSGEIREVMAKNGRMMYFKDGKRIKKP